jgi:phospholipid/cholesterol/gamma-HCH transport system substrate-binding protein
MNSKVNYTVVGAFVLAGMVLAASFVYWLMKPTAKAELRPYRIYFSESVSGLNIDSPVKYRGITVGKVKQMQIDPENNEQILIRIDIDDNTPIKTDTVARLTAQGITGLLFIDLSEGSREAPLLQPAEGERVAVIASAPSFFERFGTTMGSVTEKLSSALEGTSKLLSEQNRAQITQILEHTAGTMKGMERLLSEEAVGNVHVMLAHGASAAQRLDVMMPRLAYLVENSREFEDSVKASFLSIMTTYKGIGEAMAVFKAKNESGHYSVKDNIGAPMKEFELSMRELQQTLAILNRLLVTYESRPSDMLFKSETPNIGPGEKR